MFKISLSKFANFSVLLLLLFFFSSQHTFSQNNSRKLIDLSRETFKSNPDTSIYYCKEAEKINDPKYVGEICICNARYLLNITDYENCEIQLHKGISFLEKKKDLDNLARAYSLKSTLHGRLGEIKEQDRFLLKAYHISKKSGNIDLLIYNLINLSYGFDENGHANTKYYLDELRKNMPYFDREDFYYFYQNSGSYFKTLKKYDTCLDFYLKAKSIAEKRNMLDSKATILMLIANIYRLNGNLDFSEKFALESYNFSKTNNFPYETSEALLELIEIYQEKKDYKKAFFYQKELNEISNKILNIEKLNKVNAVEQKLKNFKSQQILEGKNLRIEQEKIKNSKSEAKTNLLSLILIFSSFLILVITYIFIRSKKLNKIIQKQKHLVEEKNKEITDSITYAKRIQSAILPQPKLVKEYFKDSFILYKPKDIVAGDFYWFEVIDDLIFFASADCTGHGVPGALVSVVCHNALNRSVKEFNLKKPSDILDKTREIVISEFEKSDEDVKDGMDISLCAIDLKSNLLNWSGAHNPLWILRKITSETSIIPLDTSSASVSKGIIEVIAEIMEYKGDKQPIGKFAFAKPFTNHAIQLAENDEIYISTDGFQDQFGGEKGKKFKASQLKEYLILNSEKTMNEKLNLLDKTFENWKGELEQVDDVCIIGVKI